LGKRPDREQHIQLWRTVNNQTSTTTNNISGGLINPDLSYNGATPPGTADGYMGGQVYQPQYADKLNTSFLIYSTTPFANDPGAPEVTSKIRRTSRHSRTISASATTPTATAAFSSTSSRSPITDT
jgi:hypothetical protein